MDFPPRHNLVGVRLLRCDSRKKLVRGGRSVGFCLWRGDQDWPLMTAIAFQGQRAVVPRRPDQPTRTMLDISRDRVQLLRLASRPVIRQ